MLKNFRNIDMRKIKTIKNQSMYRSALQANIFIYVADRFPFQASE